MNRPALPLCLLAVCLPLQASPLETVIVTANRAPAPLGDIAGSITALEGNTLDLLGATHINESLNRVSGTWVTRGNGQEHLTAIRSPVFTGSGSCGEFLIAEDGIGSRAAGFCNANQLFELNTEQAGRIEVLRGPASALYGSNAMHGAINVLTAVPEANGSNRLGLEMGPHDFYRSRLTLQGGEGPHQLRLDANGTTDGGYANDSGYDQQKVTLRHRYQQDGLQIDNGLSASNLNQETASFVEGHNAYRDDGLRDENPSPEAFRDAWSMRAYSRWQWQDGDSRQWSVTPYIRSNGMRFLQHFVPWQPLEENGHRSAGVQGQLQWQGEQLRALLGVDAEFTRGYVKETQAEGFSPTLPAGVHYDFEVDARMLAGFAQLEWQVSEATQLTLGGRFESTYYDYDNQAADGSACGPGVNNCRFIRVADRDDTFEDFSPRLGMVHALSDDHRLYASIARGVRAPQVNELYRLQSGQQLADIDSETLDSVELGLRGEFGRVYYDVALFDMRKDNFIFQDTLRQIVDNGETTHTGLEYSVSWQFADAWRAAVSGSYARHRYDNPLTLSNINIDGNDIDTAPRHFGSAQLHWQPSDASAVELEWVYMGRHYTDPENRFSYDGHDLLHLRARHTLDEHWQLSFRVANLTDRRYAERADVQGTTERYFVGEPRSVYTGVEYRW